MPEEFRKTYEDITLKDFQKRKPEEQEEIVKWYFIDDKEMTKEQWLKLSPNEKKERITEFEKATKLIEDKYGDITPSVGGKKLRRKTSKKSHRKSSKKQRKSRRARKSRRGRR